MAFSNSNRIDNQHTILSKIKNRIESVQFRWAAILQKETSKLSYTSLRYIMALFIIISASISGLIIIKSLMNRTSRIVIASPINIPHNMSKSGDENTTLSTDLMKSDHQKLFLVIHYIDSLKNDPKGKNLYRQIITYRPGLIDTLNRIKFLYTQKR